MLDFVVSKLISLMGPIATLSKGKRELKDNALKAISAALRETKLYYRNLEAGKERDLEEEAKIVRLWGEAAIPLRHIDGDLAMICEQKSQYWVSPENWSSEEITQYKIKLQNVDFAYRQLALPAIKKERRFKSA